MNTPSNSRQPSPRFVHSSHRICSATAFVAVYSWLALAGCGGGDGGDSAPVATPPAAAETAGSTTIVVPLLDDEGRLQARDVNARPADAAAWTTTDRYASPAQARVLTAALGDAALQVEVECCGIEAVERAVGIAWAGQTAYDLPASTPVLVRGADLRLAAAAANRLAAGGLTHVWLVTP